MNANLSPDFISSETPAVVGRPIGREKPSASFRLACLLLWAALLGAPLALGSVEPWAWPVLTLLALGALASWGVDGIGQRDVHVHWSPLYGLGLSFLALGFFQLFAGRTTDPAATRDALILLATDLIFFFLAGQLFTRQSARAYVRFGGIVTAYAAALGLVAIFQAFTSRGLIYWIVKPPAGAVFGPYINRNDYAGLMEMLIPVATAYAFTRRKDDRWRALSLFAVVVAVASLLLSGSRGGMVALLAEIVIFAVLSVRLKFFSRWRTMAMAGALIAAVALSAWASPARLEAKIESVAAFPVAPEVTLGQRLVVARDTWRIAWAHPWLGAGLGDFMTVFPRYQSFADSAVWEHAHNDYAEALAETGLAGGLLLLTGLVIFLRTAFGKLSWRIGSSSGWVQIACALGCCGLLVHSLVDFNLHIPANAAWFSVCLGAATAPAARRGHAFGSR